MYKYIPIKATLNYVPKVIRDEEDELNLISYAFQGFREAVTLPNLKYEYKLAISKIIDHKALLPEGVQKIADAAYSDTKPTAVVDSSDPDSYQGYELSYYTDWSGDARVLVYQVLMFTDLRPYFQTMRYAGQNTNLLTNDCLSVYCTECFTNFSISRDMSFITCDEQDGYALLVYKQLIQEDGEFLIPDDITLLRALGFYVEAEVWRNRAAMKEQGAEQMYEKRLIQFSQNALSFQSKATQRSFRTNKYGTYIFDRFKGMQRLSTVSGKGRNRTSWLKYYR